ncbi:hypothetical protein SASPL_106154 [Salvia splendens]|uniref:Uncharacterized protein n=1 Tax=Salvia splendens TaxID=180675 RepID=A0A8X9A9Z8_SALSN|nr:hypothetical protein SASPL_106154 [Salvia splendens]
MQHEWSNTFKDNGGIWLTRLTQSFSPSLPMQTSLKISLSPQFTLVSQCASLGDRAQVEQLVQYIAILRGIFRLPTLTGEVVVKVEGMVWCMQPGQKVVLKKKGTSRVLEDHVNSVLRYSEVLYKQSKGIMSTQRELSEVQALMKENLAQGIALLQSSY